MQLVAGVTLQFLADKLSKWICACLLVKPIHGCGDLASVC